MKVRTLLSNPVKGDLPFIEDRDQIISLIFNNPAEQVYEFENYGDDEYDNFYHS